MLPLIGLLLINLVCLICAQSSNHIPIPRADSDQSIDPLNNGSISQSLPYALQSSRAIWFDANFTSINASVNHVNQSLISWSDTQHKLLLTSVNQWNNQSISSAVVDQTINQLRFQFSAPLTAVLPVAQTINESSYQSIGLTFFSSGGCTWPACSLVTIGRNYSTSQPTSMALNNDTDAPSTNQTQPIPQYYFTPGNVHIGLCNASGQSFTLQITIITRRGNVTINSSVKQVINQWNFVLIQFPLSIHNGSVIDLYSFNGHESLTVGLNGNDTVPSLINQAASQPALNQPVNITIGDRLFNGSIRDVIISNERWNISVSYELMDWLIERWWIAGPPSRMIPPTVEPLTSSVLLLNWQTPRSRLPIQYYVLHVLTYSAMYPTVVTQSLWIPLFSAERSHQYAYRPDVQYSFGLQGVNSAGISVSMPHFTPFFISTNQTVNMTTNMTLYSPPRSSSSIYFHQAQPTGVQIALFFNSSLLQPVSSIALFYSIELGTSSTSWALLCSDCALTRPMSDDSNFANIVLSNSMPGIYQFKAHFRNLAGGTNSSSLNIVWAPGAASSSSSSSSSSTGFRSSSGLGSSSTDSPQTSISIPPPPLLSSTAGPSLRSSSSSFTGSNSSTSTLFNQSSSSTGMNNTTNSTSSTSISSTVRWNSSSSITSALSSITSSPQTASETGPFGDSTASDSSSSSGNNDSVLVGLVIGLSLGAIMLSTLVYCCFCRKTTALPPRPVRPEDLELGSLDEEWHEDSLRKAAAAGRV